MNNKKIVCVDLDGTLAHYEEWKGEQHFGNAIKGAKEALLKLKKNNWLIIIYTTRGNENLIKDYLDKNDLVFDYINKNPYQPHNTNEGKPIADVYIDDRAIQFNGDWSNAIYEIEKFKPWEKRTSKMKEQTKYGHDFLIHDFDQSYQQLRHYDSLNWDITKFSFIELLLGIAAVWAIYGFAKDVGNQQTFVAKSYEWIIPSVFGVCYVFSLLASFLISRNRVYYAKVARYLNEHRGMALSSKPHGFINRSRFYTNDAFPPAFDTWSTQIVCLYVIQLVSSFMFGAMLYCLGTLFFEKVLFQYVVGVMGGIASIIINLWIYIAYMKKQDEKLGKKTAHNKSYM